MTARAQSKDGAARQNDPLREDHDEPECPFCSTEFHPDRIDNGVAFGTCHKCREAVAVEIAPRARGDTKAGDWFAARQRGERLPEHALEGDVCPLCEAPMTVTEDGLLLRGHCDPCRATLELM